MHHLPVFPLVIHASKLSVVLGEGILVIPLPQVIILTKFFSVV